MVTGTLSEDGPFSWGQNDARMELAINPIIKELPPESIIFCGEVPDISTDAEVEDYKSGVRSILGDVQLLIGRHK